MSLLFLNLNEKRMVLSMLETLVFRMNMFQEYELNYSIKIYFCQELLLVLNSAKGGE